MSGPWTPTSVYFVASTLTKGAPASRAMRRAISVLPQPISPHASARRDVEGLHILSESRLPISYLSYLSHSLRYSFAHRLRMHHPYTPVGPMSRMLEGWTSDCNLSLSRNRRHRARIATATARLASSCNTKKEVEGFEALDCSTPTLLFHRWHSLHMRREGFDHEVISPEERKSPLPVR